MRCRLRGVLLLALIVFASLLLFAQRLPHEIVRESQNAAHFSVARAHATLERLARKTHPVGSLEHDAIFEFLRSQLTGLGLNVTEQQSSAAIRMAGSEHGSSVHNLLAIVPGTQPTTESVLLTAHYDSAPLSRGAGDDGAAVAALLETARALKAGPPLARSVFILFSDAEEVGLLGALAFVTEHPLSRQVGLVVNFEARGTRGPELLYQTSPHNGQLIDVFARAVRYPRANSLISRLSRLLPNDADTSIYERAGYSVLGFAFAEGLEHYHQYSDGLENLDIYSLGHAGSIALDLARSAAQMPTLPGRTPDAVYFDVAGKTLIRYPVNFARVLGTLVALGWFALLRRELGRRRVTRSGLLRGAKLQLLCVGVALVAPAMLLLLRALTVDSASILRNAPVNGWGDCLVVAALFLLFYSSAVRQFTPRDLILGGIAISAALSLLLGWFAPDASAPWQWVTAITVVIWRIEPQLSVRHRSLAMVLQHIPLAAALGIFGPIVITAVAVAGPGLMPLPIVIAASVAGLFLPTLMQSGIPRAYLVSIALAALGFALMIASSLSPDPRRDRAPASSLIYAFDATRQTARLATEGERLSALATVTPVASRTEPLKAFLQTREPWLQQPAPVYPTAPSRIAMRAVSGNDTHLLDVSIDADPAVRCVRLWQTAGEPVTTENIAGKTVEPFVRFSPRLDELGLQLMSGRFSAHTWNLRYCGLGREPLRIRLRVPRSPGVKLQLVEERGSLPKPVLEKFEAIAPHNTSGSSHGETWVAQELRL